ncbi:MAG TPA: DNA/RNA helicase domain-containing protein, partial [Acetobacteraceae bacterium]
MQAWWSGSVDELLSTNPPQILGILSVRLVETHPLNRATQIQAWRAQIDILRAVLSDAPRHWRLLLEYPLLRLGRRIDAVLLTDRAVIVLEFKVGSTSFTNLDRQQVEDYALDLVDFHSASRSHPIVPVLVATAGRASQANWPLIWHGVTPVFDANADTLGPLLREIEARLPTPSRKLDMLSWEAAPYRPVPTIIEAARMLYGRHGVADIAAARADVGNLTQTTTAIHRAIAEARDGALHVVVFVTGIPGAGKTLCGLNAVFGADSGAAFLTGNLPLVHVMREALARDARDQRRSIRVAR